MTSPPKSETTNVGCFKSEGDFMEFNSPNVQG